MRPTVHGVPLRALLGPAPALAAVVLLAATPSFADVQFTFVSGQSDASSQANRYTDLNPDICADADPPNPNAAPLSFGSMCSANRAGASGGSATASATSTFSASPTVTGVDGQGKTLVSGLTATATANGSASASSVDSNAENRMQADAGAAAGGTFQFRATVKTLVTIAMQPSGDPQQGFDGCYVTPPAGQRTMEADTFLTISFRCVSGANFMLSVLDNESRAGNRSATLTVTFAPAPDTGACCTEGGAECADLGESACGAAGGDYQGDGTTCAEDGCGDVVTWIDPAGGDYADESNWEPPRVPVSTAEQDDTAVFDLGTTYGVNVAGARAKRFVIRNSSLDLVGGTAAVTSSSPSEPSLVIGQGGKMHLVSGTFTSVDSVLGDVSGGGLAEVDLISGGPTWSNTGRLTIGDAGPGRLTVVSGQVTSAESRVGGGMLGAGEAIVGGPGSWTTGNVGFGFGGGAGTLEVRDGGVVLSDGGVIGVAFGTGNVATVTGTAPGNDAVPSLWFLTEALEVGKKGAGLLEVLAGGRVRPDTLKIGNDAQAVGTVRVKGAVADADPPSAIDCDFLLDVGANGIGDLFIEDGGLVLAPFMSIGTHAAGTVVIEGGAPVPNDPELVPSALFAGTDATVGVGAVGEVRVREGGAFVAPLLVVGLNAAGTVDVDDGLLFSEQLMRIGINAAGTTRIAAGGGLLAKAIDLGETAAGAGHLTLTGRGPGVDPAQSSGGIADGHVRVGLLGSGELVVRDGAKLLVKEGFRLEVTANGGPTDVPGRGVVRIEGENPVTRSEIEAQSDVRIGGRGEVKVSDGASLKIGGAAFLGGGGAGVLGAEGVHATTGDRSSISVTGNVVVGANADGDGSAFSVIEGARAFVHDRLFVGGLGDDAFAIIDGVDGATRSTLVVDHAILVSEESLLSITAGAQVFSDSAVIGAGSPGTAAVGATRDAPSWVIAHTLEVGNPGGTGLLALCPDGLVTVGDALTIASNGTLQGAGRIVVPQTVNAGSVQPGCSPGTLTIDGDYVQGATGKLRIEIAGGAAGQFDALEVIGDATLAGTLEIAFVNGFAPRAGDTFEFLRVLGDVVGDFTDVQLTGLPPGWKVERTRSGNTFGFAVQGDLLCYKTAAARGAKFPKELRGTLGTAGGTLGFTVTKPVLLCQPSGPSTGSQQDDDARLRAYAVADADGDPLLVGNRTLAVTNGVHATGGLVVVTGPLSLVVAPAAQCLDVPAGSCPADLDPPPPGTIPAFVCAAAKRAKTSPPFPKNLTTSAVDAFGEPRTYKLAKPTRVCAPTTGDLGEALVCYAAKPVGKSCAVDAPTNAAGVCKAEPDCGGTKKATNFCGKSTKHAKRGPLTFATTVADDRAGTVKPLELCLPSTLSVP